VDKTVPMLQLKNVSKQYGSKILFEDACAFIGENSRIALIGPNGSGKSTLIRMILGLESPDFGSVSKTKNISIGHLAQEVPKTSERTVLEEVMRLDGRRNRLLEVKQELELEFSRQSATDADLQRYGRITEELEHLDGYRLEPRAKEIISGMGFKSSDFHRPLTEFSGGWLMRVALSRVLLMDPDLLLLDEPTNHLDLESLLWLEEFLNEYHGALLLVSHDTRFLNRMVTEVLEIDQRKVNRFTGNLDSYAIQKEERLQILRAQYSGQQAKIAQIEAFVSRFGAKATKARQAQSKLKQLEKMDRIELPENRSTVRFRFPPAARSGKEVVTMDQVTLCYGSKTVFRDLKWVIPRGKRVAVVGVNGAGKTTMLKLLAGILKPTSGELKHGHQVKAGYYAQLQAEGLDLKKTVFEELQNVAPEASITQLRSIAGAFLFSGDAVEKKCSILSGGEKARVALAKLLLFPSNFLVLDEPTNHLDIESRGVLLDALQDYEGTLCLVSHDREFISPLVDSVLEIVPLESDRVGFASHFVACTSRASSGKSSEGDGSSAIPLVCDYEDYLARKTQEVRETHKSAQKTLSPKKSKPQLKEEKSQNSNQKRTWQREREKLEAEITQLEKKQGELSDVLSDEKNYENRPQTLQYIEEQKQIQELLSKKLNRWEEVCLLLES